jgi:hypothetical protein
MDAGGAMPTLADVTTADAGYFSEAAVDDPSLASTGLLVPPHRQKHGTPSMDPGAPPAPNASAKDRMRHTLASIEGRARYRMRKAIVEPVLGQIEEAMASLRESAVHWPGRTGSRPSLLGALVDSPPYSLPRIR